MHEFDSRRSSLILLSGAWRKGLVDVLSHLDHYRAEAGVVEPVQPGESGERSAERLSVLETLCQEQKLLGERYLRLLEVRVRFQPEFCAATAAAGSLQAETFDGQSRQHGFCCCYGCCSKLLYWLKGSTRYKADGNPRQHRSMVVVAGGYWADWRVQ